MADDGQGEFSWLTPAVRGMPVVHDPQTAQDLAAAGVTGMRLMHLNESPYPPSPRAAKAVVALLAGLNRYPAVRGRQLAEALASHTGVPVDRIVIGSGSTELIHVLTAITTLPGDDVVVPAPSFPGYMHAARLRSAKIIRTKLDAGGASDAKALAAAVTDRTRLVWCCTPNPPTGAMMNAAALEYLAAEVPENIILVVDEAYIEFARLAEGPDALPLLARRRGPWAILRTFSKAYGLSSLRVGYALCSSDELAQACRKAMPPYNVSDVALAAAHAALADQAYLLETLRKVARERERLSEGLRRLDLDPMPSAANFVSVKLPIPAARAAEELERRSILVRDWRDPDHLLEMRITVGLPEDTDAVLAALRDILAAG